MRCAPIVLLAPLAGCGHYCNLMYTPSTLGIEFEAEAWEPGTYEIEASGYNQHAMCVFTLPHVQGDVVHCTDNVLNLDVNPAGDGLEDLFLLEFAPDSFRLTILLDGDLVAEDSFTPAYDIDEPNGEGCGERRIATVTMSL